MIRIGYDATSTAGPRTGIGVVAAQLLSALAAESPEEWRVHAWINSPRHPLPVTDPWMRSPKISVRATRLPGRALLWGWRRLGFPPAEALAGRVDLFHSPASYIIPTWRARRVVTVHDLHFLEPEGSRDPRGGGFFAETFPRGLHAADRVIAVSGHTRDAVIRAYGVDPARITVIHNGIDHAAYSAAPCESDAPVAIHHCAADAPYFFCLASFSPRKNLAGLLDAYAMARRREPALPMLLMAGESGEEGVRRDFETALDRHGLRSHVRLAGYVPTADLPALYRRAAAFIMPSFSEGFGLPVIEAMACGCPVIASDGGALPEVAGGAALMIDPRDPGALAEAMIRLVGDDALRRSLAGGGPARAAAFTWERAARATLQLYRETLGLDQPAR